MDEKRTEQEQNRIDKLEVLSNLGVAPFGHAFKQSINTKEIFTKYSKFSKAKLEKEHLQVAIAGRIILKRGQGKAGFMHIKDRYGKVQIYVRKDSLPTKDFLVYKQSDLGDIIGVKGYLFRTNTNELSIHVAKYIHLTKALKPLPEKFHGLQNVEEGRRKRYLDLITSDEALNTAFMRPKIIKAFRDFFDSNDFVEVETPVLQPVLGGANARPFTTFHNALHMNFYLRIATEIALKKLIVGGMERVYEIGRLFRNEGMDSMHNPEFTTVEAYMAYSNMEGMMDLVEKCLKSVVKSTLNTMQVNYDNQIIDFKPKFRRIHMLDCIKEECGVDFFQISELNNAINIAKEHNIKIEKHYKLGHIIEAFFEKYCEAKLINPTYIYGHPLDISPLAKKDPKDPRFTRRFELFINGHEYANAYSELNDPIDQKERFLKQVQEKENGNDEAVEMDKEFIEALEYGLPPTGGLGIGIDRFVMLLTNSKSIRDVILFPHLKDKD